MISGETKRGRKVRRILRYHVPNKRLYPENLLTMCCFYFIRLEMKKNCFQVFHQCLKETAKGRSPECCKHKQNEIGAIW